MKRPIAIDSAAAAAEFCLVLCAGMNARDSAALQLILDESGQGRYAKVRWILIHRATPEAAIPALSEVAIPIVVCDCDLMPGAWREMLERIAGLTDPPLVIVTSRLADEGLWAEALNLGAYDVAAKPFDAAELRRIFDLARGHWQVRHGMHKSRTRHRKAAAAS